MHARLETNARHADRFANTVLVIDDVVLRQRVNHLAIERQRDVTRLLEHARDVFLLHFVIRDRDDPVRVDPLHVRAGDADAGHVAGLLDGLANARDGRLDVDDDALAKPLRLRLSNARDIDSLDADLAHNGADLRRADIQSHNDVARLRHFFSVCAIPLCHAVIRERQKTAKLFFARVTERVASRAGILRLSARLDRCSHSDSQ